MCGIVFPGGDFMCVSICGSPRGKYTLHFFVPKDKRGSGFTPTRKETASLGEAMHQVMDIVGIRYAWGTLVGPDGDVIVSFGKPEH